MYWVFKLFDQVVVIAPILLWLLVIGPLGLYPVARWKANREPYPDPQLGLKVALHYFRMISFQLLLVGATVVLWTVLRKSTERGDSYRQGFALILPAALVFGAHVMLLMRTNDHVVGTVRRLFLGYNLVLTGLLGLLALVTAFQTLFAKGSTDDEGRIAYAALVVYVSAWIGSGWHFMLMIDRGADAPPQNMAPPSPMAGAAGGVPGLPSLGGGFPPVNQ
jgi:hypothetical protein